MVAAPAHHTALPALQNMHCQPAQHGRRFIPVMGLALECEHVQTLLRQPSLGVYTASVHLSASCRKQVDAGELPAAAGAQQLQQLQDKGQVLGIRSQRLLALASDQQAQLQFAAESSGQAAGSLSCITCMDAVRQAKDEVGPV